MTDNVNITAGSGTPIATDEIGGAHYQRVKVTFGPDGSATDVSASNKLPVDVGTVPVTGSFYQATQPVSIATMPTTPVTGTFWQATQPVSGTVSVSGSVAVTGTFYQATQPISAASLPLPTGAATETTLAAVNTKTPSLGQTTMEGSVPVTIASNQSTLAVSLASTTITGSVAVTGTFYQATQPISAASLPLPTGAAQDSTLTGGTQQTKITDGTNVASVKAASTAAIATDKAVVVAISPNNTVAATQSGTWNIGSITTLPSLVAGSALVGKVGLDQTTPGTTNAVSLAQVGSTTVATGNGVVGTGVQRVAIASDNTAFNVIAAGNVASGTADSGNPVKIGGTVLTTAPAGTYTTGQRADLSIDAYGGARVVPGEALTGADASANNGLAGFRMTGNWGPLQVAPSVFNGSTWDRQRGMGIAATTGDTGAKTATFNGATQTNVGNKGVQILVVIGTVTGTSPTCTVKVQGSVDGGTTWYDIPGAATASLTATGNYGILIYPGVAVTAGTTTTGTTATASMTLPRNWRIVATIGGTTPSFAFTAVQYNYLVN